MVRVGGAIRRIHHHCHFPYCSWNTQEGKRERLKVKKHLHPSNQALIWIHFLLNMHDRVLAIHRVEKVPGLDMLNIEKKPKVQCHTRTLNGLESGPTVTRKGTNLRTKHMLFYVQLYRPSPAKGRPCRNVISWCVFPDWENPGTKLMGRNVCLARQPPRMLPLFGQMLSRMSRKTPKKINYICHVSGR